MGYPQARAAHSFGEAADYLCDHLVELFDSLGK